MSVQLVVQDGSPNWWESPAIWVVPGNDPNGAAGTPVAGQPAYLWVTVANQGDVDASQVQVDFWVANPSLQIRKSTANHIGTSFADVAAGTSQDVLCLVPWGVTIVNGGHECVVVEAGSPADPLDPPPADPDVLDALTYPQIGQRNLSVASGGGMAREEILLTIAAGTRADAAVDLEVADGDELPHGVLASLGLDVRRLAKPGKVVAGLSATSLCGVATVDTRPNLRLEVARGTSAPAYLHFAAREPLAEDEYAIVKVVERDQRRMIGGLSVVIVHPAKRGGASR